MAHVQDPGHVWRRDNNSKGLFGSVNFSMEDILVLPEFQPFILRFLGLYFEDSSIYLDFGGWIGIDVKGRTVTALRSS